MIILLRLLPAFLLCLGVIFIVALTSNMLTEESSILMFLFYFFMTFICFFGAFKARVKIMDLNNDVFEFSKDTSTFDTQPAKQYSFDYVDSKGARSSRSVVFRSVTQHESNGNIYLNGICTEKRRSRKFRADNMNNLINLDTGECIADAFEYFKAIYSEEIIYS
ncbi:hypothetical protein JI57_04530 [Psychromonas sp. PRT-SC03]|nr:hypothetical protein JI57_04530 [Psychromonas sp. PRT-SC03]